jgi:hypothetical protein
MYWEFVIVNLVITLICAIVGGIMSRSYFPEIRFWKGLNWSGTIYQAACYGCSMGFCFIGLTWTAILVCSCVVLGFFFYWVHKICKKDPTFAQGYQHGLNLYWEAVKPQS